MTTNTTASVPEPAKKRARISQSDIPAHTLKEALRVAQTICDQFAKQPTKPLSVETRRILTKL